MQAKILELLKRAGGYVSGEQISSHLKISRQGLWKHIQDLRDAGYDIVAVPHLGYQLVSSPDRLFPFEVSRALNTKYIGRKLYYLDAVSSTMDIAVQLGLEGAQEGTVVLAEAQTKGRGRLGRSWFSPKYKGIYASVILKPDILPSQSSILSLLAAVSICEGIKDVTGIEARIKWPNDILIHGKKAGGILTEMSAETDAVRFVVVGIGLNVNNDEKSLVEGATCLKAQRKDDVDRVALCQELLRKIEANYLLFKAKGAGPIIEKWHAWGVTLGRRVKVMYQHRHLEGLAVDIDKDGGLLLRKDSGLTVKVTAGDVVHCR
ncbi:MAG TPA: biotin--[acetyl-CoA-carboxylase] ligase [Patescibacteria group bacterium]|nr:biotin--[acetyl-CoA-carboxylase] ligase [Patescibacteria group bacterium]